MNTEISIFELSTLTLYLGSIVYFLGIIIQIVAIFHYKHIHKNAIKIAALILLTLAFSIFFSILILKVWVFNFDIMFGPILLPAVIPEIIFVILFLRIFGFKSA